MTDRPAYVRKLADNYKRRNTMSVAELRALIDETQLAIEADWDSKDAPVETRCATPGCNHRRYPASANCFGHATGHSTYATALRAAEKREARERQ